MRLCDLRPSEAEGVATLLDEALDLAPEQRGPWQAALERREPRVGSLIAELLANIPAEEREPAAAPDETAVQIADHAARALAQASSFIGRHIGPYRVLSLLGRGGMGSVWLAERADGLFERKVALKLLHEHVFAGALRERFARERKILAGLAHPLIAGLLDAGIAADGQPYLALEYVQGATLTAHCDQQRLNVRQRVALMTQVLTAVQHAHRSLVIHRDLKPTNILVTPSGEVRLLDFGIAKLMTDGHARETELTQEAGRALTLDYASPEQITGRPLTTASDVYSLGVVLYTLLCGQKPYRVPRASRAALEDAILSAEPVRASQQPLSAAIADARATTSARLARALQGDLDTILSKALKKDPAERYGSADALLDDLQRYLHGQPVLARPDSLAYRSVKFVARNRLMVALGLCIAVALLSAAGFSRVQASEAQRQARRALAVQQFLLSIFRSNTDQSADPVRARQTTARELLDVGARQVATELNDAPEVQAEVLDTLADMYHQLELGKDAARMRMLRVDALRRIHGPNHAEVADALLAFADDVSATDQRARGTAAISEAIRVLDALGDHSSDARGRVWLVASDRDRYLSVEALRRDADSAVRHFREHPGRAYWSGLFHALQASARAHYWAGEYAQAEAVHREALAEIERHVPGPSAWSITPLVQIAEAQYAREHVDDAERNLRNALALSRRLNGERSGSSLQTQAKLGGLLHATGRRDEGMRLLDDAHAALGDSASDAPAQTQDTRLNARSSLRVFRGSALLAEGRLTEAERVFAAEVAERRALYPASIPLSRALLLRAGALTALGRYAESQQDLDEAWALWLKCGGRSVQPSTYDAYRLEYARLSRARGDSLGAEAWLRDVTQL